MNMTDDKNDNGQAVEAGQRVPAADEPRVDKAEFNRLENELLAKQNLPMAIIFGLVAALISAVIWAGIAVASGYEIGWLAIGVGFLVGKAVSLGGKGVTQFYGVVGAILALVGILVGKYFTIIAVFATEFDMSMLDVALEMGPAEIVEFFNLTFSPVDLAFYAIAIAAGYKYGFTEILDVYASRKAEESQ